MNDAASRGMNLLVKSWTIIANIGRVFIKYILCCDRQSHIAIQQLFERIAVLRIDSYEVLYSRYRRDHNWIVVCIRARVPDHCESAMRPEIHGSRQISSQAR